MPASGYRTWRHFRSLGNRGNTVISIVLAMLIIMIVAGVIVLYVAFPHRGEDVPHTPWVGDALRKGVDRLPTLDNQRNQRGWDRETSDV